MKLSLIKLVVKTLRETADLLDAGNSELSESEAMDIMGVFAWFQRGRFNGRSQDCS